MQDGLYIADFHTPLDEASGVIVIQGDTVYGGDSGMYYTGSLARQGEKLEVELLVRRHNEVSQSVFGDFDDFKLRLSGRQKGEDYVFEGRADAAPALRFQAVLRRARS